jgi:hypothetical protein
VSPGEIQKLNSTEQTVHRKEPLQNLWLKISCKWLQPIQRPICPGSSLASTHSPLPARPCPTSNESVAVPILPTPSSSIFSFFPSLFLPAAVARRSARAGRRGRPLPHRARRRVKALPELPGAIAAAPLFFLPCRSAATRPSCRRPSPAHAADAHPRRLPPGPRSPVPRGALTPAAAAHSG